MRAGRATHLGVLVRAALIFMFLAGAMTAQVSGGAAAADTGAEPDSSPHAHGAAVTAASVTVTVADCSGPCRAGPECSGMAVFGDTAGGPGSDRGPDARIRLPGALSASRPVCLEPPPPRTGA